MARRLPWQLDRQRVFDTWDAPTYTNVPAERDSSILEAERSIRAMIGKEASVPNGVESAAATKAHSADRSQLKPARSNSKKVTTPLPGRLGVLL